MKCPFCGGKMSRRFYQMECFDCGESPSDAALHRIRELEARIEAKENLLRWRKVGEEMPEVQGDYHVVIALSPNVSAGVAVIWAGNVVAHPEIFTHWRPIGPMPTEEPAAIARAKGDQ